MKRRLSARTQQVKAFFRTHKRPLLISLGVAVAGVVLLQLLHPGDRALPFSSTVGHRTDFKPRDEIIQIIQDDFGDAVVQLVAGDNRYTRQLAHYGASVNPDEMATKLLDYPLMMRLIPFSYVWYQPHIERFSLDFDETQLASAADGTDEKLSFSPRDAALAIKNGELEVTPAANGQTVKKEVIVDAIKTSRFGTGLTEVAVSGDETQPRVRDEAIASVKKQAEDILAHQVTIRVNGKKEFKPSRADVAGWITITTAKNGDVSIALADNKLIAYLEKINKDVRIVPVATVVTLRDGKEISRKTGKAGNGLNTKADAVLLKEAVISASQFQPVLELTTKEIAPLINYTRTYTASQAGLSTYVADTTAKGDIKISVRQLDGARMWAEGGAYDSIPNASTYKLYIMLRVFDDIKQGKREWSDMVGDETLSTCFERMIVVSANNCSEALIKEYSAKELTDYLHDKGFSNSTGFMYKDATRSTAADLAKLLVGIENGSYVSGQNRSMLLEKMGRQVYRNGIPAGSKGAVYDKVGFLWDYNHDAAIVRHPQGTYVLVVMTKGHSFGKVAEITRKLEELMYP